MDNHIVIAKFDNKHRSITTRSIFRIDRGMELQIEGLTLPNTFVVDFSNGNRNSDDAIPQIAENNRVLIPNQFLIPGAKVYAYIVLSDTAEDLETVYTITIPVQARPNRTNDEPTPVQQDVITQAIAALNAAVAQCGAYVEHYPTVIDGEWYVWDEAQQTFVTTGVLATGNGIASARLNSDYTLTLVFTDGSYFTTPISIRGATGDSGVYIGDTEPTDPNQTVWIDTSGQDDLQTIVDMVLDALPTWKGGEY